jgi:hypothetical protein
MMAPPPVLALSCGLMVLLSITAPRWAEAQGVEQTVSTSIVGNIDKVKRQEDGRVVIVGWSLDIHGNGAPVSVVSIYDEQIVFTGTTSGARGDISKAYAQSIADNVGISGVGLPVNCRAGQKVITLAVTARHQIAVIGRSPIEGCP